MISHRYRALFIHIPKCAGTSIEQWSYVNMNAMHYIHRDCKVLPHMRNEGMEYIVNKFSNYFIFTFVRNPFDRFVSLYEHSMSATKRCPNDLYHKRSKKFFPIYEYAELVQNGLVNQDWKLLSEFDRYHAQSQTAFLSKYRPKAFQCDAPANFGNACAFIGRFEHLEEDFRTLQRILGTKSQAPLPSIRQLTDRVRYKHYSEWYDTKLRNLVTEIYAEDLDYLGYFFEEEKTGIPSGPPAPDVVNCRKHHQENQKRTKRAGITEIILLRYLLHQENQKRTKRAGITEIILLRYLLLKFFVVGKKVIKKLLGKNVA